MKARGTLLPSIVFEHPGREAVVVYDYLEALALTYQLCEALKVFPQHVEARAVGGYEFEALP